MYLIGPMLPTPYSQGRWQRGATILWTPSLRSNCDLEALPWRQSPSLHKKKPPSEPGGFAIKRSIDLANRFQQPPGTKSPHRGVHAFSIAFDHRLPLDPPCSRGSISIGSGSSCSIADSGVII